MATKIENIIVTKSTYKSPAETLYGRNPSWIKNLHAFGEVAIVAYRKQIKSKLKDRGFPAIFVGYPEEHSKDVYIFYSWKSKGLIHSRDVVWINKNFTRYNIYKGETVEQHNKKVMMNMTTMHQATMKIKMIMFQIWKDRIYKKEILI